MTLRACSEEFRSEAHDAEVMCRIRAGMLEPTKLHSILDIHSIDERSSLRLQLWLFRLNWTLAHHDSKSHNYDEARC